MLMLCLYFRQIAMYEDKMTRLKQEQKRLQELNYQYEDEVGHFINIVKKRLRKLNCPYED